MWLCVGVAVAAGAAWIYMRKRYAGFCYVPLLIFAAAACGILAGIMQQKNAAGLAEGKLLRGEPGAGESTVELMLGIEGETEQTELPYEVIVGEQKLGSSKLAETFEEAKEEAERTFLATNESLDHVTEKVELRQSYVDGLVTAVWQLDDYEVVSTDGTIDESAVQEEGTLVMATVELTCQETVQEYSFGFLVYPREKTKQEQLMDKIGSLIEGEELASQEKKVLELPAQMEDYKLSWQAKPQTDSYTFLFLGFAGALGMFVAKRADVTKQQEQRARKLLRDYPDIVSKLALLTSAGMTGRAAWEKIVLAYEQERERKGVKREAYEEMCVTYYELSGGVGEQRAYEHFAARCGLQEYRRLVSILVQNLNRGSAGLGRLLEQEVIQAYLNRRNRAKQYGEEASTKLLVPMMMMLGIVLAILMIPAAMSLQI